MAAQLLALLFLLSPALLAQPDLSPGEETLGRARSWRAKLAKRLEAHKAAEPKGPADLELCRSCAAGQDLVDECYRVEVADLQAEREAPKTCDAEAGTCEARLSNLPFDRICVRRLLDPLCRAMITHRSQRKALDKSVRELTDACAPCCGKRADWERRLSTLEGDLAALDSALAKEDLASLLGASARAERHSSCDWLCL